MKLHVIMALFGLGICVGCAPAERVEPHSSASQYANTLNQGLSAALDSNDIIETKIQAITGPLSLPQALNLALTHNPRLKALAWDVRMAQAGKTQARLRPNPELAIEMEGLGGAGPRSGFDGTETTVTIAQTLELGDKRQARTQLASHDKQLTEWDMAQARLELRAQTAIAFAEVVISQEREALAQQQVELSQDLLDTVRKRVQAGKDSPVEQGKAQIALSSSQIDLARDRQTLAGARIRLASAWAGKPTFSMAALPADRILPPPAKERLEESTESHPLIARWADEIAKAQAQKSLARSAGVPDVAVEAGLKRYEEDHDNTAVVGVALPLPVFNRNQGAREQAVFRLAKIRQLQQQASLEISAALDEAHSSLITAYERIIALREEILPGADTAFQGALTGYKQGKFGYLDVLDAQRTLFEVKQQYIEAQADYHKARANLEQLIGRSLDSFNAIQ